MEPLATAALIGGSIIFCFICWFFWSRARIAYLKAEAAADKARAAAVERQALQAELQLLQAQVEPHMLFNTLANLQGLIAADPLRAQHMLAQLIHYLRAMLPASRAEKTSLKQAFALLDAYLGLMKVRMGPRLSYRLELPDELHKLMVPPALLQSLVENAIRHGLEPKVGGGDITIRAACHGSALHLVVADTGVGLDAAPLNNSTPHIGLAGIRERLQALYGDRADVSLKPNAPCGAIAELTIPL